MTMSMNLDGNNVLTLSTENFSARSVIFVGLNLRQVVMKLPFIPKNVKSPQSERLHHFYFLTRKAERECLVKPINKF